MVNATPHLTPGKESVYPQHKKMVGPRGRYGRVWKDSAPPGFELRDIQVVTSSYTNCAIPHLACKIQTLPHEVPGQAQTRGGLQLKPIHNPSLNGGGQSVSRSGRFYPGKDPVTIVYQTGWASRPVWTVRKTSSPAGFDPRPLQPDYTDCAIPANYLVHTFCSYKASLVQGRPSQLEINREQVKRLIVRGFPLEVKPNISPGASLSHIWFQTTC